MSILLSISIVMLALLAVWTFIVAAANAETKLEWAFIIIFVTAFIVLLVIAAAGGAYVR